MHDSHPMLEYAFEPAVTAPEFRVSLARFLALGYVAICTASLILMGVVMALRV
jgi:hypothetical protein